MAEEWFGVKLRQLREAAGLTRNELAEKAGVSARAITQWERGEREPSWGNVRALAAALGTDCRAFEPDAPTKGKGKKRST